MISSYFLVGGEQARKTVARLLRPDGFDIGSGFLVGPSLLLTNFHVLGDAEYAATTQAEFDFVCTPRIQLTPCRHELDPERFFYADRELDYALVAVKPHNDGGISLEERSGNCLIDRPGKAEVDERVNIIQHPHEKPQMLALRDNKVVGYSRNSIFYVADTLVGSSGSPVWNDEWDLVALHRAGAGPLSEAGTVITRDGQEWDPKSDGDVEWQANVGVRISRIVESLKEASAEWPQAKWDLVRANIEFSQDDDNEAPVPPHTPPTQLEKELATWSRLDEELGEGDR
jgi:hypothetical protein